jgi:hypothetical protein
VVFEALRLQRDSRYGRDRSVLGKQYDEPLVQIVRQSLTVSSFTASIDV